MRKFAFSLGKQKLLAGVMLAALLGACSSDVSRFDDPFANPFKGSSRFDNPTTGSVRQPSGRDMRRASYDPVSTGSATTEVLPVTSQSMPTPSRPIMSGGSGTVQGLNPALSGQGFRSGVAASNYPALSPVAQRSGTALTSAATATTGWTAVGGTAITLGQGDTVSSLSSRYGVPSSAILAVNGLSPGAKLSSGQQLMIPAYNAVQGTRGGNVATIARPEAPVLRPVERVAEARREVETLGAPPASLGKTRASTPVASAPASVRHVGAPAETDAERRAAAKLRELKAAKPSEDDEADEAPARPKVKAVKPIAKVDDTAEKARLAKAEKAAAEKAATEKVAAEKARSEKLAANRIKGEKAAADKAAKTARARKADDDVESTGSIAEVKAPVRAPVAPKVASADPVEQPKPAETASNDSFRWPAKGRVISGFGSRGAGGSNDGINIALPEGTPVRAAEGGVVVHADDALKGYGKMVLIRHPNGYVSVYANNGDLNVKRGETVKRGQVVAHSGATGNVTSPQLHFELRKGAQPVDPTTRLSD